MGLDMTSADAALKYHYTPDNVENLSYYDNPLFALMPKMEKFGGKALPIPIIYGNPQGRSASFSRAQTNAARTNSRIEDFILTRAKDYSLAHIDNETLKASENDADAFMEAATTEIDGAIQSLSNSIAQKMYRQGWGEVGQVGSFATTTITLLDIEDVTAIEVGMELVVAADIGTSAIRALGTSANGLIVTGVNRRTGVMTFGANVDDATDGIPTIANSDYIFIRGDRGEGASPSKSALSGLEAWIPYGGASATTFFGVNRTVDTRLAGQYLDGTDAPLEEVLNEGVSIVGREGGRIDHFFMSWEKYNDLENSLGTKAVYIDLMANAAIGFRGIVVNSPRGPVKCIADRNCPSNRIFGLQMNVWKLYSLGKAVDVIDTDGLSMLRQNSSDGVEVRYGFYGQVGCRAPGWNISIAV